MSVAKNPFFLLFPRFLLFPFFILFLQELYESLLILDAAKEEGAIFLCVDDPCSFQELGMAVDDGLVFPAHLCQFTDARALILF